VTYGVEIPHYSLKGASLLQYKLYTTSFRRRPPLSNSKLRLHKLHDIRTYLFHSSLTTLQIVCTGLHNNTAQLQPYHGIKITIKNTTKYTKNTRHDDVKGENCNDLEIQYITSNRNHVVLPQNSKLGLYFINLVNHTWNPQMQPGKQGDFLRIYRLSQREQRKKCLVMLYRA